MGVIRKRQKHKGNPLNLSIPIAILVSGSQRPARALMHWSAVIGKRDKHDSHRAPGEPQMLKTSDPGEENPSAWLEVALLCFLMYLPLRQTFLVYISHVNF